MTAPDQNRLAASASPYLLQHKHNPVHWQPWDDDALVAAREHDRPILLSIGYAACHWCHVMAHESFEDDEVAALMNRLYINIKVDREERPDIDQLYMAALTAMGEQGGWPLTMILTPDGKPFWGGTYFPKYARYGRPGFLDVLVQVEAAWRNRRDDINANALRLQNHLQQQLAGSAAPAPITPEAIANFSTQVAKLYDPELGGLSGAPKFPNAPFLETLWRAWMRDNDATARDRFLKALTAISLGGIYDHVGGGLARYAVDGRWLVPHFEKMLYDNAHFIRHSVWAHSWTQNDLFRYRIEETIAWLQRDMLLATGGFSASLDANSEGEEGKYYVWSLNEVADALGSEAEAFSAIYDVSESGNCEGKNIVNLFALRKEPDQALAAIERHRDAREKLLDRRQNRIPPGRDTKVLADWNGYAIRAIADAARYFGSESWLRLAVDQFAILKTALWNDDRLSHVFDGSKASDFGFATDYAAMINAALSLFEATGDRSFVQDAVDLCLILRRNHYDFESNRGFWMQERDRSDSPMRTWNDLDEANPSTTAQVIEALSRLVLVTEDVGLTGQLDGLTAHAAGRIMRSRFGQAGFMNAGDSVLAARKLVIVGEERTSDPLWAAASQRPDPRRIDVFYKVGETPDQYAGAGAYLCTGMICTPPVTTADALRELLDRAN
ncbi:thioredoxin domain-containing protein [Oricola sp.]|uniref:thioredoxin domain-containing protein n=1 Tax=Oricola sp. TaxID=1979950 RepID=UPI0025EB5174|nr:thioredoxin domain-containing protein [Oricola sp.]MCI5077521.1 thioredoxin domain-containing protein [Oricola sp.]